MFYQRHAERAIKNCAKWFPTVLVTGARQVGKSTLLQHCLKDVKYVSLDDGLALNAITQNAYGFLTSQGTPVIYDEIQQAGSAFRTIKLLIDRDKHPGMFYLTGSQKYVLMKNLSDSLAGRIAILELFGLSNRELDGDDYFHAFMPTGDYLKNRKTKIKLPNATLWQRIQRGSYPELWEKPDLPLEIFYETYLQTYLERDVRQLSQVGDLIAFRNFMVILAARIGGLLNLTAIARDAEIDVKTAKRWLSILEAGNVIYLLQPFSMNATKRVTKTPKLYFCDTGLVCYLTRWITSEVAESGAQAGALFENYVIMEILKSYYNAGERADVYFYRDSYGHEIDLIFFRNNTFYPVEIKKTASPNIKDVKNFQLLKEYFPTVNIGEGGIICTYDQLLQLNSTTSIIPVEYI